MLLLKKETESLENKISWHKDCQGYAEPCAQDPDICREHLDIHKENYLTGKYKIYQTYQKL